MKDYKQIGASFFSITLQNVTYDRSRKDSFYWYKKVIASNGADLD